MLTFLLIFLLLSNALTIRQDKSILFSRVVIKSLLFSAFLAYDSLQIKALEKGVGIYGGLFNVTTYTQSFNIFILVVAALILTLNTFYFRKVYNYIVDNHTFLIIIFFILSNKTILLIMINQVELNNISTLVCIAHKILLIFSLNQLSSNKYSFTPRRVLIIVLISTGLDLFVNSISFTYVGDLIIPMSWSDKELKVNQDKVDSIARIYKNYKIENLWDRVWASYWEVKDNYEYCEGAVTSGGVLYESSYNRLWRGHIKLCIAKDEWMYRQNVLFDKVALDNSKALSALYSEHAQLGFKYKIFKLREPGY